MIAGGGPSPDGAAASCVPPRLDNNVRYHDGWTRDPPGTTIGGVYSTITEYDPYIGNDTTSAWVMLRNPAIGPQPRGAYFQGGWLKDVFNGRRVFMEWNHPYFNQQTWPPEAVGLLTTYTVLYGNFGPAWFNSTRTVS